MALRVPILRPPPPAAIAPGRRRTPGPPPALGDRPLRGGAIDRFTALCIPDAAPVAKSAAGGPRRLRACAVTFTGFGLRVDLLRQQGSLLLRHVQERGPRHAGLVGLRPVRSGRMGECLSERSADRFHGALDRPADAEVLRDIHPGQDLALLGERLTAPKSSGAGRSASNAGAASKGQLGLQRRARGMEDRSVSGRPRCSRIRVTPALDVTAATIAMRPEQRVHARRSSRNTRQISDAHGSLPCRLGASAPAGAAERPDRPRLSLSARKARSWIRQRKQERDTP
jgi:hypothetical protein